jgi:enediyne polyketide synthase
VLGDPARNDASIHALQVCVPHRRVLPVGCEQFAVLDGAAAGPLTLRAVERAAADGLFVYDVEAADETGQVVVRWTGLRLRDVGPLAPDGPWTAARLGPYLERMAAALLPVAPALRILRQVPGEVRGAHPPASPDGVRLSRSHLGDLVLEARSGDRVACDWERLVHREGPAWSELLGPELGSLARQVAGRAGEAYDVAASRVWTVLECLSKVGRSPAGPLVIAGVFDDGWMRFRAGHDLVASVVLPLAGADGSAAIAVLSGADA